MVNDALCVEGCVPLVMTSNIILMSQEMILGSPHFLHTTCFNTWYGVTFTHVHIHHCMQIQLVRGNTMVNMTC